MPGSVATCLHCLKALPPNDVVAPFPFGRQMAYDPAKQRLWVVCSRCRRWSIAPLVEDERAAEIDRFERWWRDNSSHYSTGGIGLGQMNQRFSLVRIGDAGWNEFAAWRYARTLRHRRWKYRAGGVAAAAVSGAFIALGGFDVVAAMSTLGALWMADHFHWAQKISRTAMCRVPTWSGRATLREKHMITMELTRQRDTWTLNTQHDGGVTALDETQGVRALSYALPRLNIAGASQRTIDSAMSLIGDAGGPEGLAHRAAEPVEKGSRSCSEAALLLKQPDLRLIALEIATQEQNERRLMEGELALLRAEWQEAEEIATISDSLLGRREPWDSRLTP